MFVVEKTGLVRIFAGGKLLARPFLDLRSRVRTDGEGGLLSIAFHPHYRTHPVLWVGLHRARRESCALRGSARGPRPRTGCPCRRTTA